MKLIVLVSILLLSANLMADECISDVKAQILSKASSELGMDGDSLKVRLVGGEQYDGDLETGTTYKDHFGEYFDVFNINDDTSITEAHLMYAVDYYVYSDTDTGLLTDCEVDTVVSVSSFEWSDIYETYDVGVSESALLIIPVYIGEFNGEESLRSAKEVNQHLQQYGIGLKIPELIEVSSESSYALASSYMEKVSLKVEEALTELAQVDEDYKYAEFYTELVPGDSWSLGVSACYSGNAHKIFEIIRNLSGSYYSEQLTPWGYKYRDHTGYYSDGDIVSYFDADDETISSVETVMSEQADLWGRWAGYDETLLISTAYSDSGTDVTEALIKKCASGY